MSGTRTLKIDIIGDPKGAQQTFSVVEQGAGKLQTVLGGIATGIGAGIGLAAVEGVQRLGSSLVGMVGDAQESAKVTAQLGAVLKSTGGVAGVTAEEVEDLSASLSNLTGMDDEAITSAQSLLLTFTNISKDVFPDTTKAVLDLSAAMGQDFQTSATQLGKALNDPIKGITALTRVGVTFTEQQKEQIAAMVEAGNVADAQRIILAELNKEFGGSAEAQATNVARLTVAWGNLREELGGALLPVIEQTAGALNEFLRSEEGQAGIKRLAEGLATAAENGREFAIAALSAGRAFADVLGPPLQAAVGWFSSLDETGQRNVIMFGAVALAAFKFRNELGALKGVVEDVIGAFGRKKVAKEALTKANEALAGSAGKTAVSFGAVRAGAVLAGEAIAAMALVTGGAVVVAGGMILALDKYNEATGGLEAAEKDLLITRRALTLATEHGADAGTEYSNNFLRYLQSLPQGISGTEELAAAWNDYVKRQERAGNVLPGVTAALTTQQQAQLAVNQALGEGKIAGQAFNDMLTGMAVGANAAAAAMAPVAESINTATNAAIGGGAAIGAMAAATVDLQAAFGDLGSENGKLSGLYNTLESRIKVLQDQQEKGIPLTIGEQEELATLIEARRKLGEQMGDNAATQRSLILSMVGLNKEHGAATTGTVKFSTAIQKAKEQIPPMEAGLVGLADGYGNIATQADLAARAIARVHNTPPPPTNPVVGPNAGGDYLRAGGGANFVRAGGGAASPPLTVSITIAAPNLRNLGSEADRQAVAVLSGKELRQAWSDIQRGGRS
jgi:hypothetical protein